MAVMCIRPMSMGMRQVHVTVLMGVWFNCISAFLMVMLMMFVVNMPMIMLEFVVSVFMAMPFGKMKPRA